MPSTTRYYQRREVAALARRVLEEAISYDSFMALLPEVEDEDVEELVDLITHTPKKGGFLGVSAEEYDTHVGDILRLIEMLESK